MRRGNLTLDGQTDYIEEVINQPKINEFLVNMKKHNVMENMEQKAQERKNKGTLSGHKPTYWENSNRIANELINEHPNAVSAAKKLLGGSGYKNFKIEKSNEENLRKARLIGIVAISNGRTVTRTTDPEGNRILEIDKGKTKSK